MNAIGTVKNVHAAATAVTRVLETIVVARRNAAVTAHHLHVGVSGVLTFSRSMSTHARNAVANGKPSVCEPARVAALVKEPASAHLVVVRMDVALKMNRQPMM
ncbi:MAG TPA: hypothetical protein DHW22_10635 [Planctomycetaceae bacterium]|nr:hypothetical protein [Planctomycetaceae bacterium]